MNQKPIHEVALVRSGGESYSYTFDDAHRRDTLWVIGRQAINPELSLDWRDALILEQKICELSPP